MRPRHEARLYLARSKDRAPNWVIRDGPTMIRTGAREDEPDKARDVLHAYMIGMGQLGGISSEISYRRQASPSLPVEVYFITCEAPEFPIKIGIASNVERRIRGLQNALPFTVVLLKSMPGSRLDEQHIHNRFKHLRIRGEWFRRSQELFDFINETGDKYEGWKWRTP